MKSYYYFMDAGENDTLCPQCTIFIVPIGVSAIDQKYKKFVENAATGNLRFYFSIRDAQSTPFIRRIMDEYQATLKRVSIRDLRDYLKSCFPCHVKNLSDSSSTFNVCRP